MKKGMNNLYAGSPTLMGGRAKIVQIQRVKCVVLKENASVRAKIVQNEEGNDKFYCAHVAPTPIRINPYWSPRLHFCAHSEEGIGAPKFFETGVKRDYLDIRALQ